MSEVGPATSSAGATVRARRRFFVAIASAMLGVVLVGFAPTLYLRAAFPVFPVPSYLYVHGALLTTWFVLVVAQPTLIRRGSVRMHQRLGIAGACLAAAVVAISTFVTLRFVGRVLHAPTTADIHLSVVTGFGTTRPLLGLAASALWGNLTSLAIFTVLVGSALLMRRRGDVHKRLMILASMAILPPAIARISRLPGLGGDMGPLVPAVLLVLLLAIVGFDLHTRHRVHRATLFGAALLVLGIAVDVVLPHSEFGRSVVRALG